MMSISILILSCANPELRDSLAIVNGKVDPRVSPLTKLINIRSARVLGVDSNYATKICDMKIEVIATDTWSVPIYGLDSVGVVEPPTVVVTNREGVRKGG
jgi:hypothetical protein